jgi:hypothetical protein
MDKGTGDFLIKAGAAVGAVAVGGYALLTLVKGVTGPSGGSCTDPSTPCGAAVAPYAQEFQSCLTQYTQYFNQFVSEDQSASPPTGLTTSQLATLANLQSCMDTAAKGIGAAAQSYGQSPLDTIAAYAAPAFAAAVVVVGLAGAYKLIGSGSTASTIAASVRSAILEARAAAGDITSSFASAISNELSSLTQTATADDAAALSDYYSQGLIALADEEAIAAEDASALADDLASLQSVFDALAVGYLSPADAPVFGKNAFQGSLEYGPVVDVQTPNYNANAFGYPNPGGTGMVYATPAADDCGCKQGLVFGRGAMWMLTKK